MNLPDMVASMTAGLRARVALLVGRCVLSALQDSGPVQTAQIQCLAGEVHDDAERIQEYGFTSVPLPGAEGVALFVGGSRDHGLVIASEDRRYRLRGLPGGEVALYDDLGQRVHLHRSGVTVSTPGKLRLEAADIELHASHSFGWDVAGFGQRWTWLGAANWQNRTWQTGATVTPLSGAINPPEGP